jgi:hypothetical protein
MRKYNTKDIEMLFKLKNPNLVNRNIIISLTSLVISSIFIPISNKETFLIIITLSLILSVILSYQIIKLIDYTNREKITNILNNIFKQGIKSEKYLYINYLLVDQRFHLIKTDLENLPIVKKLNPNLINLKYKEYIKSLQD